MIRQSTNKYLIRYLDSETFPGEDPVDLKGRFWVSWEQGEPVAFAGLQMDGYRGVYFHRAGVLPRARGRGLQRRLIAARLAWARAEGKSTAVTYTVQDNLHSANNLMDAGFRLYTPQWAWAGDHVLYWFRSIQ